MFASRGVDLAMRVVEALVTDVGPPSRATRRILFTRLTRLKRGELRELAREIVRLLGYEVTGERVAPGFVEFMIQSETVSWDAGCVLAASLLVEDREMGTFDVCQHERSGGRALAYIFAPWYGLRLTGLDHPVEFWSASDIVDFLVAILHSEFTLTELTYFPWPIRANRIAALAESVDMTCKQLLRLDRLWRQFRYGTE